MVTIRQSQAIQQNVIMVFILVCHDHKNIIVKEKLIVLNARTLLSACMCHVCYLSTCDDYFSTMGNPYT